MVHICSKLCACWDLGIQEDLVNDFRAFIVQWRRAGEQSMTLSNKCLGGDSQSRMEHIDSIV